MNKQLETGSVLLNKYRIEGIIGRGGFGAVYRATDLLLKRVVAVKTLLHSQSSLDTRYGRGTFEGFLAQFQQEAQVSGHFTANSNIVTVYSLDQDADSNYYLILEYLENGSLANLLKGQKQLPIEQACWIVLDLCRALAEVHNHSAEIVHRDIKPSNILLRTNGEAVLADFGIAQVGSQSSRSEPGSQRTHPGSPSYCSPEQLTTVQYLTPASDLYGLGLVLYEALTGRVFARVRVLPPSLYRPDLPVWLDRIVFKLLQEEIGDRYWEADQLTKDIRQGLRGQARPAPVSEAEEKTWPLLAEAAHQAVVFDSSPPLAALLLPQAAPVSEVVVDPEETVKVSPEVGDEQARRLAEQEARRREAEFVAGMQRLGERVAWGEAIELGRRFLGYAPTNPVALRLTARAFWSQGIAYYRAGQLKRAEIDYRNALELDPTQAEYYAARAYLYYQCRDYARTLSDLVQAIELASDRAEYYHVRSQVYFHLGYHERVIEEANRAIRLDPSNAMYYYMCAMSQYQLHDYHQAIAHLERAINRDPHQAAFYYQLGLNYDRRGSEYYNKSDLARAQREFGRAVELDPRQPDYYYAQAINLVKQGEAERAIGLFDRAIGLDDAQARYYYQRGLAYALIRQTDQAIENFDQAIRRDPRQADYYYQRGLAQKTRRDRKAARADLQKAASLNHQEAHSELANSQGLTGNLWSSS